MRTYTRRPIHERLYAKILKTETCWIWTGALNNKGYGVIGAPAPSKALLLAHRVSYDFHVGPIPEGLTLDHLCYTPRCVNPEHLEPVTKAENIKRAAARKTHCAKGHLLVLKYRFRTSRFCRICKNERRRAAAEIGTRVET